MLSVNSKTKSRSKPKLKRNDISRLIEIFANTKTLLENTNSENKVECDEYLYNKNFEETIVHSNQEKFKALKNDVYMTSFN